MHVFKQPGPKGQAVYIEPGLTIYERDNKTTEIVTNGHSVTVEGDAADIAETFGHKAGKKPKAD